MDNKTISVLTLNLRFGLANDGINNWEQRKEIFPFLLTRFREDFIGFQEANDFQINFIDNILTEYNFIGQRSPAPVFWQNNIIFYKKTWKCIFYEHFFLSSTPTVPSRFKNSLWPRQCTLGIFQRKDQKILCVNTHFDFNVVVQEESAKIIIKHLSLLPEDIPVILVGDFNAIPHSPCYIAFTGNNEKNNQKVIVLNDVFSKPFPGTHHGFTGNTSGDYIDWILYRGNIKLFDKRVIHDKIDGLYPSDHFPVYAAFIY